MHEPGDRLTVRFRRVRRIDEGYTDSDGMVWRQSFERPRVVGSFRPRGRSASRGAPKVCYHWCCHHLPKGTRMTERQAHRSPAAAPCRTR